MESFVRQGVSNLKVISSGRLENKKKVSRVHPHEPAFSLYSTDSEDQVTTVHKGLDRCAALLDGLLRDDETESKLKPKGMQTKTLKSKLKNSSRRLGTDRKKHGKKTNTTVNSNKKTAPVQKSIPSISPLMTLAQQPCVGDQRKAARMRKAQGSMNPPSGLTPVAHAEHEHQISCPPAQSLAAAGCYLPDQFPVSTVYNSRLTTSTPAPLSPQEPESAHIESCCAKCVLNTAPSPVEIHRSAATTTCTQGSVEISGNPNQHDAWSMAPPTARRDSPVIGPRESWNPVYSVHTVETSASLVSSIGSLTCPSLTALETKPPGVRQSPFGPGGPELITCTEQEDLLQTEQEEYSSPVRDIRCETSADLGQKATSQEKTTQRVMTVNYLLGELKTLVAHHDIDAVHLITEVEQSISLLPAMVGSTNIQAEIALALQPLRSENVQLRRRLRILNQQLLERERAERRVRPEMFDLEVVALQSLNVTLQSQLTESRQELEDLQLENVRLQKALDETDSDWKHHRDLCELENSRLRLDVKDALAELQRLQKQLHERESERIALRVSLQQRETEITALHELIRNLQRTQSKAAVSFSSPLDMCQANSQFTKSILEWHESSQEEAAVSDKLSNSVKSYLQTLEAIGKVSPGSVSALQCPSETLKSELPAQTDNGVQDLVLIGTEVRKHGDEYRSALEAVEDVIHRDGQKTMSFGPLKETPVLEIFPVVDTTQMKSGAYGNLDYSDVQHAPDPIRDVHVPQSEVSHRNQKNKSMFVHSGPSAPSLNTFSSCDLKSLASDCSMSSWSTFNTQDEQNFKDGLAALDASIESLQKTLRVDFNK